MDDVRCPVVELRQYTLHPGQRETLIDLFDREFVETQEAAGTTVLGQFRDLDDPDRFVWLRGFGDMPARAEALTRFYGGPVWRAHARQANATMVDFDDVLLLRPVTPRSGFPAPASPCPPADADAATPPPSSAVLATIYRRDRPFDDELAAWVDRDVRSALAGSGAEPLACLQTEHAENTFPALPVRAGENVVVWFARFTGTAALDDHLRAHPTAPPALAAHLTGPPQHLRLTPTARSLLR